MMNKEIKALIEREEIEQRFDVVEKGIDYLDCKISPEWAYYKTHPIRRKGIINRLK